MSGEMALESLQAGLESARGTLVPATRIEPILGGWFKEVVERSWPDEIRNSFIKVYRNFPIKNYIEVSGLQIAPTYEGLGWWLQLIAKGGVTGILSATTAYTYTFTPTIASDDLKTASLEFAMQAQNYAVGFGLGNKMELAWGHDGPMTASFDLLGQKATAQAKTGALSAGAYEDIIGPLFTCSIDTTTIGSTLVTNVIEGKFTLDNHWAQEYAGTGFLYPNDAHRSEDRSADVELTLWADAAGVTEYNLFRTSGAGTPRKIRTVIDGTVIPGSAGSLAKRFTLDKYVVWDTAEPGEKDGKRTFQFKGKTQYDTTATYDWSIALRHGLSALP